jgi:hypothetical protein
MEQWLRLSGKRLKEMPTQWREFIAGLAGACGMAACRRNQRLQFGRRRHYLTRRCVAQSTEATDDWRHMRASPRVSNLAQRQRNQLIHYSTHEAAGQQIQDNQPSHPDGKTPNSANRRYM